MTRLSFCTVSCKQAPGNPQEMEKKKPNTTLELNIISCYDLKSTFNFYRKLNTYVTVSVLQDDDGKNPKQYTPIHSQKTPTDRNGDRNPEWNHPMKFEFETIPDEKALSLEFNVMCKNSVFGDRKIGDARLPLKDLQFDKSLRYLVLSVKKSDGKEKGKLNMSWKFSGERAKIQEEDDKIVQMKGYSSMKSNADAYLRAMQTIKWPILPSVSVRKISCRDGSRSDKILCPLEMKSLSFDTGFDQLKKDYKKHSISGSTKWEIELDPRDGRFPGLSVRNRSECSY